MPTSLHFLRWRVTPRSQLRSFTLVAAGAVLLVVTSYIHWHLWQSVGYRHIPTIGWMFLSQWITGLVIALALVVVRELWVALVASGFVASTMGGFLLSVTHGLFGFHDSWFAPFARTAFSVEVAALVILLAASASVVLGARGARRSSSRHDR